MKTNFDTEAMAIALFQESPGTLKNWENCPIQDEWIMKASALIQRYITRAEERGSLVPNRLASLLAEVERLRAVEKAARALDAVLGIPPNEHCDGAVQRAALRATITVVGNPPDKCQECGCRFGHLTGCALARATDANGGGK